jgi:16S rRNA (guanine1516-N2)-methyltransferase
MFFAVAFRSYYYYHIQRNSGMTMDQEKNRVKVAYKLCGRGLEPEIARLKAGYGIELVAAETVSPAANLPLLKISGKQLVLEHGGQTLFFHPSMALLRMINIRRGEGDRFLAAAGITPGDVFVDATMGLAADTLIAAWAVGEKGKVVALESSPLIHILIREGLARLAQIRPFSLKNTEKAEAWRELAAAARRVETRCCEHTQYLQALPEASVDIIYFDPMFRETVSSSSAIKPLRNWSFPDPLQQEAVREARRVGRKRLVLKEKRNGGEFARLGFTLVAGSKYNPVAFGTIELSKTGREQPYCPWS